MHVRELVEVAGLIALHGPQIVASSASPASSHLEQYWVTSKGRFESWSRVLKCGVNARASSSGDAADQWLDVRATLDEIFVSELLTRVWAAVLVGRDRRTNTIVGEPVARSVMASQMEARHRALELLLHADGFSMHQAVTINRLRRRAERWCDVLIGGLLESSDAREFAVEADRAADFADDLARRRSQPGGHQAWRLTLLSLRNAFQAGLCPKAANPNANARITASVLGCFPGELFDSTGLFQSLWMTRLSAYASDAEGMIEDLIAPTRPLESEVWRLPTRRRRI